MLFALSLACVPPPDGLPTNEGGLGTCALGAEEGKPAPPLSLSRTDGSETTLDEVRGGGPPLVVLAPQRCPECMRLRTLILGWEAQYPTLVGVVVSDEQAPWSLGPGRAPRGGAFVTAGAQLDAWTDALDAPRVYVVDADGTVSLRRDGFTATDARSVGDALRWSGLPSRRPGG